MYVIFSGVKVRPEDPVNAADAADAVSFGAYRVLTLESLVRMKLTANRDKDKTHLRDMLEIGSPTRG